MTLACDTSSYLQQILSNPQYSTSWSHLFICRPIMLIALIWPSSMLSLAFCCCACGLLVLTTLTFFNWLTLLCLHRPLVPQGDCYLISAILLLHIQDQTFFFQILVRHLFLRIHVSAPSDLVSLFSSLGVLISFSKHNFIHIMGVCSS